MVSLTNNAGKVNIDSGQQNELNKGVLSLQGKMLSDGPLKVGAASKLRDIIICVDQKDLPPSALLKVSFRGQSHYFNVTEPNAVIQISLTEGVDCESLDNNNKMQSARFFASGATPVSQMREARKASAEPAPKTTPAPAPKPAPAANVRGDSAPVNNPSTESTAQRPDSTVTPPKPRTTSAKPEASEKSASQSMRPTEKSLPKTPTSSANNSGPAAAPRSTKTRVGPSKPNSKPLQTTTPQARDLPTPKKQEEQKNPGETDDIGSAKKTGMDAKESVKPRQAPAINSSAGTQDSLPSTTPKPALPPKSKAKSESALPTTAKQDNAASQAARAKPSGKSQSEAPLDTRPTSGTAKTHKQEKQPAVSSPPQDHKFTPEEQELLAELDAHEQKATGSVDLKSLKQEVDRDIEDDKSDIQRFLESERPRKPKASDSLRQIVQTSDYEKALTSLETWCQNGCIHLKKAPPSPQKAILFARLIKETNNWNKSILQRRDKLVRAFERSIAIDAKKTTKDSLRKGANEYYDMARKVIALKKAITQSATEPKPDQTSAPRKPKGRVFSNLFRRSNN